MSNETIEQNNATETTSHTGQESQRALRGKIARLPKDIREELNGRLDDGQPASEILPWVNGLPATIEALTKYFRGVPINEVNLSKWRRGGYKRWVEKQESEAEIRILAEEMKDVIDAGGGTLARGTASIVAAKILKLVQTMAAGEESLDTLMKVSYAVSALMNAEQGQARLEFEKKRVELRDEELTLKWDKQQRDGVAIAQRALDDELAKHIQASDIDNGEKIELLGYRLYGGKWQGRKMGKREEAKETGKSIAAKPENEDGKDQRRSDETPLRPDGGGAATADQQVRPTTIEGNSTEVVSATDEKAGTKGTEETKGTNACDPGGEKGKSSQPAKETSKVSVQISGGLTTAATPKETDATQRAHACDPTTVKQKAPGRELSPYDKALLEGKTHLEAMYAQYTPDPNPKLKTQNDPSQPKPNPLDAFSEPVKTSPFVSLHGLLRRGSLWGSKLG